MPSPTSTWVRMAVAPYENACNAAAPGGFIADPADAAGPVGVAGVMGGRGSEVSAETTELFLECAWFAPGPTRAARKSLGLPTEASQRFERGTDLWSVPEALRCWWPSPARSRPATCIRSVICSGSPNGRCRSPRCSAWSCRSTCWSNAWSPSALPWWPSPPSTGWRLRYRAGGRTSGRRSIWSRKSPASTASVPFPTTSAPSGPATRSTRTNPRRFRQDSARHGRRGPVRDPPASPRPRRR